MGVVVKYRDENRDSAVTAMRTSDEDTTVDGVRIIARDEARIWEVDVHIPTAHARLFALAILEMTA